VTQVFIANVHYGLEKDVPCWSRELCDGLTLVQPDTGWRAHMLQLKPIEHRLVAQLAFHAFCNHLQCYTTQKNHFFHLKFHFVLSWVKGDQGEARRPHRRPFPDLTHGSRSDPQGNFKRLTITEQRWSRIQETLLLQSTARGRC
jgi:hypothetical protein